MNREISRRVAEIMALVLGLDEAEAAQANRERIGSWDSIKHMELMLYLEEEFQVRFTPEQLASASDLAGIVRMIENARGPEPN
jgi:acyl carrier protein